MKDNMVVSLVNSIETTEISQTLQKIEQVQVLVQNQLKQGHDYDTIPGTSKPTLLKPGAEKILMLFGLTSEYDFLEKIEDYEKGIFAYTVKCILSKNGQKITEGLGSCNSKENKYRWRWVKEKIDGQVVYKTKTNKWGQEEYQIENDEIFSQANTILKMAKKRSQIDAVLTVASLSELFTQDLEDMREILQNEAVQTLDVKDAGNIKLTFGKYKGMTLSEVVEINEGYLEWLSDNAKDEYIKKAATMLIDENNKNMVDDVLTPEDKFSDELSKDDGDMPY